MNKFRNKKIVYDGICFDSKKELNRFRELKILEESGAIQNLQRQVKFVLIPAQYETYLDCTGRSKKEKLVRKCIERECSYIADFVYNENGNTVVEDTKGFRTKDYIIKRKLMLYVHGIMITEI